MVGYAQMVREFCLQDQYGMGGIYRCRFVCYIRCIIHYQFPGNKSGDGKSCEVSTKRIKGTTIIRIVKDLKEIGLEKLCGFCFNLCAYA